VNQIAKLKSQYSYYMGDLVTANDLAVCYVVRTEEIRVLHADGAKLLLKGHTGQVFDVRFSLVAPGLLASACRGGRVFVWDVAAKQETPLISLRTEDASKPEVYSSKLAWHHSLKVVAIALSNDSVVVVRLDALKGTEHLLNAIQEEAARSLACSSAVLDVCFSQKDPSVLATSHHDGTFKIWNWQTGRVLWEQQGHGGSPMHAVRFLSPAGAEQEILLTCGLRCEELKLWDLETRVATASLSLRAPASGANPFYNHVFPVEGSEELVLLANAKRKDFLCLRVSRAKGHGAVFDTVCLFDISQPILSGRARLKQGANEISLFCVQESRVQEYLVPRELCAASTAGKQVSSAEAAKVIQAAARAFLARTRGREKIVKSEDTVAKAREVAVPAAEQPVVVVVAQPKQPKHEPAVAAVAELPPPPKQEAVGAVQQPAKQEPVAAVVAQQPAVAATVQQPKNEQLGKAKGKEKVKSAPRTAEKKESAATPQAKVEPPAAKEAAPKDNLTEDHIRRAVAAGIAPLLESMERDRAEARKRQAADVERQKKLLQVLQNAMEVQIPKAVEAALDKRGKSGDVSAALTEEMRRCFAELLIPRLEKGVANALGQVGGAPAASPDAELRGELRGIASVMLELSRRVTESVAVSHQQALANHTAALGAILDAVSHRGVPERSEAASPAVATPSSGQGRKKALAQMLSVRDYNAALAEVLSLKDVSWVMWLLKKIGDPERVFSADKQTSVGQPIVLSLIQQLGFGFPGDDEGRVATQLEWIQAALLVLDVESPEAAPHVHSVLSPLLAKLEAAYPRWMASPVRAQFKVVCHILHSLTK
jgi:WD40 repeat protein